MSSLVAPSLNVLILIAILYKFLKQPLKEFVGSRKTTLEQTLQEVAVQFESAKTQYEEFSGKLKALDSEIIALREQARKDAEAMRLRILHDTERMKAGILSDAKATAETTFTDLRRSLLIDLGDRVLRRTEQILQERLTGADRVRILREISQQMESVQ